MLHWLTCSSQRQWLVSLYVSLETAPKTKAPFVIVTYLFCNGFVPESCSFKLLTLLHTSTHAHTTCAFDQKQISPQVHNLWGKNKIKYYINILNVLICYEVCVRESESFIQFVSAELSLLLSERDWLSGLISYKRPKNMIIYMHKLGRLPL